MKIKSRYISWCILWLTTSNLLFAQQPLNQKEIKKVEVDTAWMQQTTKSCALALDTTKVMQEDIIYLLKRIKKQKAIEEDEIPSGSPKQEE